MSFIFVLLYFCVKLIWHIQVSESASQIEQFHGKKFVSYTIKVMALFDQQVVSRNINSHPGVKDSVIKMSDS